MRLAILLLVVLSAGCRLMIITPTVVGPNPTVTPSQGVDDVNYKRPPNLRTIREHCPYVIAPGSTVTWRGNVTHSCVLVRGTLLLADGLRARVATMLVTDTGVLRTESAVGRDIDVRFADTPIDTTIDPEQYSHGLIADATATIAVHGVAKTTVALLGAELAAGSTTLTLATVPTGWNPGDTLLLPGTTQPKPNAGNTAILDETVKIAGCSGVTCSLQTPTIHAHGGARDAKGVLRYLPPIGNLSRSITFRSENPAGTRAHVLFTGRASIDLEYVTFLELGRTRWDILLDNTTFSGNGVNDGVNVPTHIGTNQGGRYGLHPHHLVGPVTPQANGHQFTFVGLSVVNTRKWAFTIHDAHYGLIADNVVYKSGGAGLITQDGSESYNLITRNFIAHTLGNGSERGDERAQYGDFGYEGSAFWFRGPNNVVTDNWAANGGPAFAVTYMMLSGVEVRESNGVWYGPHVPTHQGADPMVDYTLTDMTKTPLRQFANNTIFSTQNGLTIWNLMAFCCQDVWEGPVSTIDHLQLWHVHRGYYGYGQNRTTFSYTTDIGDPTALYNDLETSWMWFFSDYITRNLIIDHADLEGLRVGITAPAKPGDTRDIYGNTPGTTLISNSHFNAQQAIQRGRAWGNTGGGDKLPGRLVTVKNSTFSTPITVAGSNAINNDIQIGAGDPGENVTVPDRLVVQDFQGVKGDNFETYYFEQAPPNPYHVGGVVAPCALTRALVHGYACPTTPVDPCLAQPNGTTVSTWPSSPSAASSLSWDPHGVTLATVSLTWTPSLRVTFVDTRNCSVTRIR